jgi:hypothetical protein
MFPEFLDMDLAPVFAGFVIWFRLYFGQAGVRALVV